MDEIEKRVELIGIATQLVEYVESAEGYFYKSLNQDDLVKAWDRLVAARKSLGLEDSNGQ